METPLLSAENIVKTFSGVTALDGVSFHLNAGEIHAICGENGAGKSTLIKILSGVYPHGSFQGDYQIHSLPARFQSPQDAEEAELAVIYQDLSLVPEMTVAENIFLGYEPVQRGFIHQEAMYKKAKDLLSQYKLNLDPEMTIKSLGIGAQQLVEIAKALAKKPKILLLDEPTASLSETETTILLSILKNLKKEGISCIYISHKMEEVFELADRITVIRDGKSISTAKTSETSIQSVVKQMVGRTIDDFFPRHSSHPANILLQIRNLGIEEPQSSVRRLTEIEFDLYEGEVLGIGGLMGAGRTELLLHLFGLWGKRTSGEVRLHGVDLNHNRPADSVGRGMVLVSEDRRNMGLHMDQGVGFNLSLSSLFHLNTLAPSHIIDEETEVHVTSKMVETLDIKIPSLESSVTTLSGGNQQKVVLGKALLTNPQVILLDEPTQGIDIGTKVEIYNLINQLTEEGKGIILVSSELPELIGMSDRIIMLHEGAIGGVFTREEATQENLMKAAMGITH